VKVLVTGHHGYIGSVAAPFLAAQGHEVTGVDTLYFRGCDLYLGAEVESAQRDVRDLGEDDLRGYDAIFHLAALSNDPLGDLDLELTFEINERASVRLARAAREAASAASSSPRRSGLTFDQFEGPRFTRLKRLQRQLREEGRLDDDLR
jgi:nucleoside-diphosphate-sugar epimerase